MQTSEHAGLGLPIDGLSHVRGPVDQPLSRRTIPQLLRDTIDRHGDREALVFLAENLRLSWREFGAMVDEMAMGFLALGLTKGDRVGIWSPNRFDWVLTQFATARIGLILVNINPAYRLTELEYALTKVGCSTLVTASRFKTSDYIAMIRELAPELAQSAPGQLRAARLPMLRHVIVMDDAPGPGMMSVSGLCALGKPADTARLDALSDALSPDDPINIQFTSGTTGQPKGATLSHFNIVNNAGFVTDRINLTDRDRLAIPVPLYHCFGMVMGVLGATDKGAAMVFPGEGFDPAQTLDALAAERCTAVYGVPTMFVAMLADLETKPRDLSRLRTGIMAGALCPVEIMRRVQSRMNLHEVTICYGMTETAPVSFQSFTDDPLDKRCETVGRIHPHLEVKIVDETGTTVPLGQSGELCTKGYSVMTGYWDDPARTSEAIRDGWMHTGDLAQFDQDGFCRIIGRVKDTIIRGGENISPREVEEFLLTLPGVADAQVFGIPDDRLGEVVCAWVIPSRGATLTPDSIRDGCQDQIAYFKVPRHVRIVDAFPMTVTGKPQKFLMRAAMVEALAGGSV